MDARELERCASTADRPLFAASTSSSSSRNSSYGFIYKRVREGSDESDPNWTIGRVALWPNGFYLGNHFEWRVPIDDENTLSVCWFFMRVPKGREPYVQGTVPTWVSPIKDANGRWITSHVINQDIIAWVGQGRIADRTKENLGASDLGIVMIRKRLLRRARRDRARARAQGHHPQCRMWRAASSCRTFRSARARRRDHARGLRASIRCSRRACKASATAYGQPPEVRRAFEEAMGIGG